MSAKEKLKEINKVKKIIPASVFRQIRYGYCKHKNCPFRNNFPSPYSEYYKLKSEAEKEAGKK